MRIKRLEINLEYDIHSFHVFHTDGETQWDPPTLINIDGEEFEGRVEYYNEGKEYVFRIIKT